MIRKLASIALVLGVFSGWGCGDGEPSETAGVPLAATTPDAKAPEATTPAPVAQTPDAKAPEATMRDATTRTRGPAATTPDAGEPEPQTPPPGFNPYTAPAMQTVGPLRVGRGVESDGMVPDAQRTDVFMSYDPIHFSVATPQTAGGAVGRLQIYEEGNDVPVWSDQQRIPAGTTHLNFDLGPGDLRPNRYRAVLTLGDAVTEHTFQVKDG